MAPAEAHDKAVPAFARFLRILEELRSPQGCPWDREQTLESMRGFLLEESYEAVDAIDRHDQNNLREELGDVLLVAAMMAQISSEEQHFDIFEVLEEVNAKLIRRHPHVFGDDKAADAEEVLKHWERVKADIEGREKTNSIIDGLPGSLPPLERAYKIQKRASRAGFDWPNKSGALEKVSEEIEEIERELLGGNKTALESEFGDLLFSLVNYARHIGIDPTLALNRSNDKFSRRFRHVEKSMSAESIDMNPGNIKTMERYWQESKDAES